MSLMLFIGRKCGSFGVGIVGYISKLVMDLGVS